jgi:hypothetical protein
MRDALSMTYAWVLPIEVNAIKPIVTDEFGNVCSKLLPVPVEHTGAEYVERIGISREAPAPKAQDPLDARKLHEPVELIFQPADVDLPVGRNVCKGEVDMCVISAVGDLRDVHVGAGTLQVPPFEVGNPARLLDSGVRTKHLGTAVGDAAIRAVPRRSRRTACC